jgi:hypothetical protein
MGIAMSGVRSSNPSIPAVTGYETPLVRPRYRDWSSAAQHGASPTSEWLRRCVNLVLALVALWLPETLRSRAPKPAASF